MFSRFLYLRFCSTIARRRRATMKSLCVPAFVILALVSAVVPLSAHHSWPVSYDRLVTVKGTVIEFMWANPHPIMTLEVQTNDGLKEKWVVGGPAINRMEANGWTKTTVKPGDVITDRKSTRLNSSHVSISYAVFC